MVKGVVPVLLRRTIRAVLWTAALAAILALVRVLLGRLAGEPGVGPPAASPSIPMSLDRWPPVPSPAGSPGR